MEAPRTRNRASRSRRRLVLAERDQLYVVRYSQNAFKQSCFCVEWTGNYSALSSAEQFDTWYTKGCIFLVLEEKEPSLRECGDGESELAPMLQ